MLQANPPLAFYLANRFTDGRVDPESADALVATKQTTLLEHFGMPGTPAAMKTLRKVPPESVFRRILPSLRKALCDDEVRKQLAHVRCVNTGVLKLAGSDQLRRSASPTLLEEVGNDKRERYLGETATLLEGLLWFHHELHGQSATPPVFSTMLRVREAHDTLSEQYAETNASGILKCVFPQPPIRGTRDIVPLNKPLDLVQEGVRQRHCVASYAPAVERGDTYIYRVLRPERGTLAIRRSSAGRWYCSELRAACNQPVTRATERAVDRWLEDRTVSA
ncbi:MAG: PcfJ domain-containing protein [Planctomycetota bacterium]